MKQNEILLGAAQLSIEAIALSFCLLFFDGRQTLSNHRILFKLLFFTVNFEALAASEFFLNAGSASRQHAKR